jgi:hypothetical protein
VVFKTEVEVFTARYALRPYIKLIHLVFKGLMLVAAVTLRLHL